MTIWQTIWAVTLFGLLAVFVVLAVAVTVLGARDVIQMLQGLNDQLEQSADEQDEPARPPSE